MASNKYGDKNIEIDIIEEGKKAIKEGYLPIHGDFMTGELIIPKVWLTVEEAENLNSAINHLFGLVKLNQVKLTMGEAIALRTFDDRVARATSQFNQVAKKVIEEAEKTK